MHNELLNKMIQYYSGDPKRIQHFMKVYSFSKLLGEMEGLDIQTQNILEIAAIVHDIGIKASEEKFGNCNGKLQEQEGPAIAEQILLSLGYESNLVERVCYLVGHHHTYSNIEGLDYQILVEADFLVNLFEDKIEGEGIKKAYSKIFKTESGKLICREMFGL